MKKNDMIYIAGHTGLVGQALVKVLKDSGYKNLLIRKSSDLDLTVTDSVDKFFQKAKPDYCFMAAGRTGGIIANMKYPAQLFYDNLMIQANIVHAAWRAKTRKLLFIACSCLYPRECPQPMKEEYLMTGRFEPTNESYSAAKLAGIAMCQAYNKQYNTDFISCIAGNTYGAYDNFDSDTSHVIPALIKKFHYAKKRNEKCVSLWGTGKPEREFLYVGDLSSACLFLMRKYDLSEPINIGSQEAVTIKRLAHMVKEIVGFRGKIFFDISKPDGMPRKILYSKRIVKLGWKSQFSLQKGLEETYTWFINSKLCEY